MKTRTRTISILTNAPQGNLRVDPQANLRVDRFERWLQRRNPIRLRIEAALLGILLGLATVALIDNTSAPGCSTGVPEAAGPTLLRAGSLGLFRRSK